MAEPFRKKTYSLPRFLRDVGVLVSRAGEVRAVKSGRSLDPAVREKIMVSVARVNECRYCVFAHEAAALAAGVSEPGLAVLSGARPAPEGLDWLPAATYAAALAEADFGPVPAEVEERAKAQYGEDGRRAIETAARLMTVANLTGNTVDALLARVEGRPVPNGNVVEEAALAGLWAVGAGLTALRLMLGRGEPPWQLIAEFRRFDAGFQSHQAEPTREG